MASPDEQLALKVKWSLERLTDSNEESQSQNSQFLADIRSTQAWRCRNALLAWSTYQMAALQMPMDHICPCLGGSCRLHLSRLQHPEHHLSISDRP